MKKKIKIATLNWSEEGTISPLGYLMGFKGSSIYKILIKHYDVEFSDTPDYVFCDAGFRDPIKYPSAVRILCSGENHKPNFNIYDYAITIIQDYQYDNRCFYIDSNCIFDQYKIHDMCINKHLSAGKNIKTKSEFCSFVVSNASAADNAREEFFHILSKYKKVNSGGKHLNNVGGPVENKFEFEKKHKFAITFENTPNYVTEKIEDAFAAETVPIYWGDQNITKLFNEKAFINCHKFNSLEEVAQEVIRIDSNDEAYLAMLSEPAYINPKTSQEYLDDLENFIINIIEVPKHLAIQRNQYGQQQTLEEIMRMGYDAYLNKRKAKVRWGKVTRFFSIKKIILRAKRIIMGVIT